MFLTRSNESSVHFLSDAGPTSESIIIRVVSQPYLEKNEVYRNH